jgi:hypothetical protein
VGVWAPRLPDRKVWGWVPCGPRRGLGSELLGRALIPPGYAGQSGVAGGAEAGSVPRCVIYAGAPALSSSAACSPRRCGRIPRSSRGRGGLDGCQVSDLGFWGARDRKRWVLCRSGDFRPGAVRGALVVLWDNSDPEFEGTAAFGREGKSRS